MLKKNESVKSPELLFKEIYLTHFEKIKFFAFSYLGDTVEAKCVAQEVFLTLWEKINDIYEDRDVLPLLFVIAKYKCLNVLRTSGRDRCFKDYKRKHDEDSISFAAISQSSLTSMYYKEVEKLYKKALNTMPETVRETFLYSRDNELKYIEIAEKQSISIKTVEYRISYAFRILRKYLKDYLVMLIMI